MRTTDSITLTSRRQYEPIKRVVNQIIDDKKIEQTIDQKIDASKTRTGVINKFYPYLDKVEVKLDNVEDPVLCRRLHLFGGRLIDFFTPEGEKGYCDVLQEPCIIPREELHVLVADISNQDTTEMLMLGYFNPTDIVGLKPAEPGYMKITDIGSTNVWGIEIGNGHIKIITTDGGISYIQGEYHADNTEIHYADGADTYTKKEVYNKQEVFTKEEVIELIDKMKQEIIDEIINGDE